jgi:AAA domain/UvrD-like helicase C-terminal domain
MKLLVYDKFWDSFLKLGKTTQKKVIEFQQKFRENPKSSAINLESISTFKDQSLRTARIDQKYRAIIKTPESGDAYYLLWVDNHDEAMAWAEAKLFQWNESTQSIQVFSAPEMNERLITTNAVKLAGSGLYTAYTDAQLLNIGVPEILIPSILHIESLTDLEKIEKYLPADTFENLFYLSEGANIENLISEVKEGKSNSDNIADQIQSANNQRSFIELTNDELFNEVLEGNLNKWKYYLHPSQRNLVNGNFNGPVKVTGGAGTGKTVAALHRLKVLAQLNKTPQPVLFTTFTKALTKNLKNLIIELNLGSDNFRIDNIDALAFELAKKYRLINENTKVFGLSSVKGPSDVWEELLEEQLAEFDKEFLEKEYEEVILYHNITDLTDYLKVSRSGRGIPVSRRQRAAIWQLFEKYIEKKNKINCLHKDEVYNLVANHLNTDKIHPFAHIVVDELQDFSNVELRFIRSLVENKPNDLFLVGDPLQSIYDRKINFTKEGINVRGNRSKRLRINYRTTEEIKKLAISIIEDCHYDNFDGEEEEKKGYISLFHGMKPSYNIYKTKADEVSALQEQIGKLVTSGYQYSSIAIAARTKDGLKDFVDALHKSKIPYHESHDQKVEGERNGVHIVTFHSIKGLEFKNVFLVDINNRTSPKLPYNFDSLENAYKTQYMRAEKSLLYVACSRAIENLLISGVGTKSEMVNL